MSPRIEKTRPQFWLWPNLLSLDAPVVALLWQVLFLRCFHADVSATTAILLALAVWVIYTADRTFDALRGFVATPRHEFYRRHWKGLAPWWLAACVAGVWMAWNRIPVGLWQRGMLVAGVSSVYLMVVHRRPEWLRLRGTKEAAVGIVFAAGVSLAAWPMVRTAADVIAIGQFFLLCWMNCVAIEDWEKGKLARSTMLAAGVMVAMGSALLLREERPVLGGAETLAALGLVCLDRYAQRIPKDAARVLADVVLLTPILFLPVAGRLA